MTRPVHALVIAAHPDDIEIAAGGTVAGWTAAGLEVAFVLCTRGEKGTADRAVRPEHLARTREAEQRAAAAVLGVDRVAFLGLPDQGLEDTPAFRKGIVRQLRVHRPRIVVTSDPYRRYLWHRDHRVTGQVVMDAVFPYARDPLAYPDLLDEGLEPHKVAEAWFWAAEEPNHRVDIGPFLDAKTAALACHRSQLAGLPDPDPAAWLRRMAREAAGGPGDGLAEAFHRVVLPP